MMHEAFTLPAKCGELAVFGIVSRGGEVMIDTKVPMKSRSGHGIVRVVGLGGNGGSRDSLGGVNPGSVSERGEGGGTRRVVNANAAFVSANTKFMDNRHIAREFEVVLDKQSECGRGGRGEVLTGIITARVSGETCSPGRREKEMMKVTVVEEEGERRGKAMHWH